MTYLTYLRCVQSINIKSVSRYYVENLNYSPDGLHAAFVYGVPSGERIGLVAIGEDRLLTWKKAGQRHSPCMAWSHDGKTFAFSRDENIRVVGGECFKTTKVSALAGHSKDVKCLAFDRCAVQYLASGGADGCVTVWDLWQKPRFSKYKTTLCGHKRAVNSVAFVSDNTLVSGGADHTVRLWNITRSSLLHVFRGHTKAVRSVAVSPDGKMIVSGGDDATACVWTINAQVCERLEKLKA